MRKFLCKMLKATPNELAYNSIEEMTSEEIVQYAHKRCINMNKNIIAVAENGETITVAAHCTEEFKHGVIAALLSRVGPNG